jgi:hypothetical protein
LKLIRSFPSRVASFYSSAFMDAPSSLMRDASPPRTGKRRKTCDYLSPIRANLPSPGINPTSVVIAAGKVKIDDRLTHFTSHLAKAARSTVPETPRLSSKAYSTLYDSNQHQHRNYFVIHQHSHPRAVFHYDLRL